MWRKLKPEEKLIGIEDIESLKWVKKQEVAVVGCFDGARYTRISCQSSPVTKLQEQLIFLKKAAESAMNLRV
jgi:hypothetical protein